MSAYLQSERRSMLGLTTTQEVTGGLTAAAAVDPEPISKAILAIAAGISKLFGFGYDPKKLNDTAVTENVQIALHQIWYQLTGEDLGMNCTPGQCGAQHVAIFTTSAYPNVPDGPEGNPAADISVAISNAQQIVAMGRQHLVRPESAQDYDNNTQYLLGLFQQVAEARAANPAAGIDSTFAGIEAALGISGLPSWVPWAALALGVYAIL